MLAAGLARRSGLVKDEETLRRRRLTSVLRQLLEVVPGARREHVALVHEALLHHVDAVEYDDETRAHVDAADVAVPPPPPLHHQVGTRAHQGQHPDDGEAARPGGQVTRPGEVAERDRRQEVDGEEEEAALDVRRVGEELR